MSNLMSDNPRDTHYPPITFGYVLKGLTWFGASPIDCIRKDQEKLQLAGLNTITVPIIC